MVRKQNERTLLLHSRIITLPLHPNTSSHLLFIISTSPSISAKIGGISFTPETFPRKNFRKIFYINQSFGANFFLLFWCEKLWGLKALGAPQMGGGCPFLYAPHIAYGVLFHPPFLPSFLPSSWQISNQSGQKGAKVKFFLLALVFSLENRRRQSAKT